MFGSGFEVQVYNYLVKRGHIGFLVNHYPSWLTSPQTGRRLQLDLYDPRRKIAVEIQGPTHFQNYSQILRDSYKLQSCEKNAVKLYYVRHWNKTGDLADLDSCLREESMHRGVNADNARSIEPKPTPMVVVKSRRGRRKFRKRLIKNKTLKKIII